MNNFSCSRASRVDGRHNDFTSVVEIDGVRHEVPCRAEYDRSGWPTELIVKGVVEGFVDDVWIPITYRRAGEINDRGLTFKGFLDDAGAVVVPTSVRFTQDVIDGAPR
jgi:hypothetical protein